jgi:hypothetical protein
VKERGLNLIPKDCFAPQVDQIDITEKPFKIIVVVDDDINKCKKILTKIYLSKVNKANFLHKECLYEYYICL